MLTGAPGRVDLLITHPHHVTVLEWKSIKIDFIEIKALADCHSRLDKSLALSKISNTSELLDLRFGKNDKWRKGKTIKDWVYGSPQSQVDGYFKSPEITQFLDDSGRQFRAHLVIVVGNRKILLWDVGRDGQLNDPRLAEDWDM